MRILINKRNGGFGLSDIAIDQYRLRSGNDVDADDLQEDHKYRTDPILIEIIDELGKRANGRFADVRCVEVPDYYDYTIDEYDGLETIHLKIREDHLRKLIRLGIENDIVAYVLKAN